MPGWPHIKDAAIVESMEWNTLNTIGHEGHCMVRSEKKINVGRSFLNSSHHDHCQSHKWENWSNAVYLSIGVQHTGENSPVSHRIRSLLDPSTPHDLKRTFLDWVVLGIQLHWLHIAETTSGNDPTLWFLFWFALTLSAIMYVSRNRSSAFLHPHVCMNSRLQTLITTFCNYDFCMAARCHPAQHLFSTSTWELSKTRIAAKRASWQHCLSRSVTATAANCFCDLSSISPARHSDLFIGRIISLQSFMKWPGLISH